MSSPLLIEDLGRISYRDAFDRQLEAHADVLACRDSDGEHFGRLLLLEHDPPVITISRRKGARDHLLATDEMLVASGVELCETDRGGDITYHGPGQVIAYPILDLNRLRLNLHAYMRFLEGIVIDLCRDLGVQAHRDVCATGVWVGGVEPDASTDVENCDIERSGAKICAMGVRVRKWISMHGLALNVHTNLDHFNLIVPCGLAGRPVTSLASELGADACPSVEEVKADLARRFETAIVSRLEQTESLRD